MNSPTAPIGSPRNGPSAPSPLREPSVHDLRDRPINILLVEDNPGDMRLIKEILAGQSGAQCAIEHVDSLAAALERARHKPPHVVLLDLSLPDAAGLDALQSARDACPTTPIVVLTGMDNEQVGIEAVQQGAQDYLVKGSYLAGSLLLRILRYSIERKRAELIEQQRVSLRDTVQSLKQVLGVVGHELRTPLAAVRAMLELLRDNSDVHDEDTKSYMQMMHAEVVRMGDIITQLLDSARTGNHMAPWAWSALRLEQVCLDAIETVHASIGEIAVPITFMVHPPDLSMNGDAQAIRRLVINLLSNAVRHTSRGAIQVQICTTNDDANQWIELAVRDSGEGMNAQQLAGLGKAFMLASSDAELPTKHGAGLGLMICAGIADAHGGYISVRSQPDHGSTFTARLRADLNYPVVSPRFGSANRIVVD